MRRTHRARVPGLALLLLTLAAPATGAPRVDVVLTGLEIPWAVAFAPDGRLFVTDLARTGHLYVCYTARRQGPSVNRVARLTLRGGHADDERVLLDDIPAANVHDGCRVKFGPDRKLYVTTGDAARPHDSQNPRVLSGEILRLNADGSMPGDNPFHGSPVWSVGHRNPQGLAWDGAARRWVTDIRGSQTRPGLVTPALHSGDDTWAPSGMAFLGDSLWVAGLVGYRLLRVVP